MAHINDVISVLPIKLRSAISLENVYEIRLRAKQPVITIGKYGENIYENYIMTKEDIRQTCSEKTKRTINMNNRIYSKL